MNLPENNPSLLAPSKRWVLITLITLLACGLAVRLFDLTDPPLDYAATRQLRAALIARGMYYEHVQTAPEWKREMAITQGERPLIEPPIIESIVAGTYRIVGSEHVWIARIYTSLFWVLGGAALFFLVKEMISIDGAIIALTYYLFNPFGLIVSRSFQPESLMVALIILSWWTFYRWHRTSTWKWAALAGLSAGLAIFVKFTSIFFLLGGMALVVLIRKKLKENLRNAQMWMIVTLSALPSLLYTAYGVFIVGTLGEQFQGRFFPNLWSDLKFYTQWKNALGTVSGREFILLAGLIGLFFIKNRVKLGFLLGIWFGYIIYGFGFSYHFMTHYYYHLPVIPLLALSIGALAEYVFQWVRKVSSQKPRARLPKSPKAVRLRKSLPHLTRSGLVGIVLIGIWGSYYKLQEKDYRHEPDWYYTVASFVGREANVVALTQDYGFRIKYYGWISPQVWLGTEDLEHAALQGAEPEPFSERFAKYVEGYDYFLVTRINELERQKELHDELYNNYPIYKESGGYVIFDLQPPPK